jgi:hypothetical protein
MYIKSQTSQRCRALVVPWSCLGLGRAFGFSFTGALLFRVVTFRFFHQLQLRLSHCSFDGTRVLIRCCMYIHTINICSSTTLFKFPGLVMTVTRS